MSDCGRGCYEVGGPWIEEDPECPIHGAAAQAAARAAKSEVDAIRAENQRLRGALEEISNMRCRCGPAGDCGCGIRAIDTATEALSSAVPREDRRYTLAEVEAGIHAAARKRGSVEAWAKDFIPDLRAAMEKVPKEG